ncbi:MAG: hypothetical protein ACLFTT_18015 [Candidatus Hydrogenedentota bacterium]
MQVGFATRCITPEPGAQIPGLFEKRIGIGTHDDLHVRALVVDDGNHCVALVQVDAIFVPERLVAAARKHAARWCPIAAEACFIAATHTHSGGPAVGCFLSEADPAYVDFVARQAGAAIAEAHRRMQPALAGTGTASAPGVAFNRRFRMRGGAERTHPGKGHPDIVEPVGPEDDTVTVVGFCDPKDRSPIGCIVNFACHATHMNGVLYSADYPRWIIDTLQAVHGPDFGVVFLNGAAGDVTQVDNRSDRPMELGPYWCERTGRTVGGAAVQALARMDYYKRATVAADRTKPRISIRETGVSERKAARALLKRKEITAADVETVYARELLEVEKLRRKSSECRPEIMGVRIADAFFWGVPAELFQSLAREVRQGSPFPHTCCIELANGYDGYICTAQAFDGGGYEVRTARSSFLERDAGTKVVSAAKRLAKKMYADAEKELRELPDRRTWPAFEDPSALDGISQLKAK